MNTQPIPAAALRKGKYSKAAKFSFAYGQGFDAVAKAMQGKISKRRLKPIWQLFGHGMTEITEWRLW